jgi:hypothetical protein
LFALAGIFALEWIVFIIIIAVKGWRPKNYYHHSQNNVAVTALPGKQIQ